MSLLSLILVATTGCESGFKKIDHRVDALIAQSSQSMGPDAYPPPTSSIVSEPPAVHDVSNPAEEHPPTLNPSAAELPFAAVQDADDVLARLNAYNQVKGEPLPLDFNKAVAYATAGSREYQFAEEQYVLAGLRLLIERHRWGPRFFDDVSAIASGTSDGGLYDTSLRLINELRVTQKLPYGGEISARALAQATEDLHHRVAGEDVQDAAVILTADIPLLRGAGLAAREDLIQSERNLIYAARDFEQFRRDFLFDISQDFLSLVVQQQAVANAERQVTRLREVEDRERTLYESGRSTRFQAALAEQSTVSALDTLNTRREALRLAIDRFKVRLSIPIDRSVVIMPSGIDLAIPAADMERAVRLAMAYRLDLQTQRDQVADAKRHVDVARNQLEPDLNFNGAFTVPTDPSRRRAGLKFSSEDSFFVAGVTLGLPLDRDIERISVRQAQIELARQQRDTDQLRDNIAVNVRAAVRDIDRARYTLEIQERSIAIGQQRIESIEAAPDRASARDASDAANELARAQDRRDSARRDLQVAILRYLQETGQLRITPEGFVSPLRGMSVEGLAPMPTGHDDLVKPDQAQPGDAPPRAAGADSVQVQEKVR